MSATRKCSDRCGFTLAELLIVVAIVAILAAIAIPVFSANLEKARETACLANLTSAQRALTYQQMLDPDLTADEARQCVSNSVGALDSLCPSGGTYVIERKSYSSNEWVVRCPVHGTTTVQTVIENINNIFSAKKVSLFFSTRSTGRLDSTGPNFGQNGKQQAAEKLNINPNVFDFCIDRNNDTFTVYLFQNISSLSDFSNPIDVIQYTITESGGSYTVTGGPVSGTARCTTSSITNTSTNKTETYNLIDLGTFNAK